MKRNNQIYRTMALLLVLMLATACTRYDDFIVPDEDGTPAISGSALTITVTDGAYASAEDPSGKAAPGEASTRAVERGYYTEFTKGDRIGLYVVGKNIDSNYAILQENLCLTYNGTDWELPANEKIQYNPVDRSAAIFAYYPYQDGGVSCNTISTTATGFFKPLIENWQPVKYQNTYAAYTASDLMVARGDIKEHQNNKDGLTLDFKMEHQMTLIVIRVPTTKCTYSETISKVETKKSYHLYSGANTGKAFWMENSYTGRRLVNPKQRESFICYYYDSQLNKKNFEFDFYTGPDCNGKYQLFIINGGKETESDRPLQEGDFYMKDGSIVPKDIIGKLPKGECLGVVYWVGEKKDKDGTIYHWTQTGKQGDHLLMDEHPECTHGMVVALRDASPDNGVKWSSNIKTYPWSWIHSFDGFESEEKEDLELIHDSSGSYSYCSSRVYKLFKDHNPDTGFEAYDAINTYAANNPTPESCSGWYLPGFNDTQVMCVGTLDWKKDKNMRDTLNSLIQKAGGKAFKEDRYWNASITTNIYGINGLWVDFSASINWGILPATESCHVRAVLAF